MYKGSALSDLQWTSPSSRDGNAETAILRVEGLVKIYGKRRVVDGVSFHVNKGEIVGLLGPNGAGKTTSFRMACGLIDTNGGVVYLGNQDVTNWPMYRRSKEGGMGYLPQDRSVFQKLSVQNNLYGVMEMLGIKRAERKRRCDELLEKFQLTHLRYNYGGGLSGGERRRLEIARSLVSDPKIILLDEPFAAVDPITVTGIQEIIRHLSHEGISILITDHSVQDTLQITQRSYVIQAGQVLCHGTPEEVLSNPEARKAYFGENVSVGNLHSVALHPEQPPQKLTPLAPHPHNHYSGTSMEMEEEKKPKRRLFGHRSKPHESLDVPDPEWDEPLRKPATPLPQPVLPAMNHTTLANTPIPVTKPRRMTRTEGYSPNSEAVPDLPTRPIGKRIAPEEPTPPENDPSAGMSGIIRSLGSMVWK